MTSEAPTNSPARPAALPPPAWINAHQKHHDWWTGLATAPNSLLICDYDGTLAPFKADKMQATPFPGVEERLELLAKTPDVTLALVSGRPVAELITLLPLAASLELYGSHGREHRSATGNYNLMPASPEAIEGLDAAQAQLSRLGWTQFLERKSASLAVHWRTLSPADAASLAEHARTIFTSNENAHLAALPFESGIELRSTDQTKQHAVESLLATYPTTYAAYLGDDLTDEDAFRALGGNGLSLLVREEPRASQAHYWLRPPAQLLGFLDDWLRAAGRHSTTQPR